MTPSHFNEKVGHSGRRRYDRKSYFMVIDYADRDRAYRDFIHDISAGGLFIETRHALPVGRFISMTFPVPGRPKELKVKGRVVRTDAEGMGVRFHPPTRRQALLVEPLVELL